MKDRILVIGIGLVLIALIGSTLYFSWWRCGEMFPHAQLACFLSGGK